MELLKLAEEQAENLRQGRACAVVTTVRAARLARTSGKMIVYPDGTISGTVGGGPWEQAAVRDALDCLRRGENDVKTYDFTGEMAQAGFQCDGVLTVFIECCRAEAPELVVVGGGHVGTAVIRLAKTAGFRITLVDTRGDTEIGEAIAEADRFLQVAQFGDVASLPLPAGAFYLVSTYGHMADGAALGGVLCHRDAAYVGMLGSKKKIRGVYEKLRAQGVDEAALSSVYSPVGLDLGGETPAELAISIMAEILAVKNGGSCRHLRA